MKNEWKILKWDETKKHTLKCFHNKSLYKQKYTTGKGFTLKQVFLKHPMKSKFGAMSVFYNLFTVSAGLREGIINIFQQS